MHYTLNVLYLVAFELFRKQNTANIPFRVKFQTTLGDFLSIAQLVSH